MVISTDNQLNINEFRDALGATWPFLSDPDRVVQKDLDIQEYTDEPHDPMIPHTFVLEPRLKIFKIYNGYWYWGRPTMAELHVDLRGVFQQIRPDFDLAAPGLREAWDRGDRDRFLVDTLEEPIRYTEGGPRSGSSGNNLPPVRRSNALIAGEVASGDVRLPCLLGPPAISKSSAPCRVCRDTPGSS